MNYTAFMSFSADAKFQKTGLERSQALADDIAWYTQQFNLPQPVVTEDGPGMQYAKHLRELAADDPQYFICHFYNYYFAHTAGGRMIGSKVCLRPETASGSYFSSYCTYLISSSSQQIGRVVLKSDPLHCSATLHFTHTYAYAVGNTPVSASFFPPAAA